VFTIARPPAVHGRQHRSAQVEHRVEVDPERQLPVAGGDGQQVPAPVHSGVVHQDVDPAVALDDIVDRCDAGARLRQVEGGGFGSSAGLDDAGRDLTGPILVDAATQTCAPSAANRCPYRSIRSPRPVAGRPRLPISANSTLVSGVSSDGFSTMVLPAAIPGRIFHAAICSG
jgi:hypothetical protein